MQFHIFEHSSVILLLLCTYLFLSFLILEFSYVLRIFSTEKNKKKIFAVQFYDFYFVFRPFFVQKVPNPQSIQ